MKSIKIISIVIIFWTPLQTDGGSKFFPAQKRLKKEVMDLSKTIPNTPSSNGLSERNVSGTIYPVHDCLQQAKL